MPMVEIIASLQAVYNEPEPVSPIKKEHNQEPCPTFEPGPNTQVANFNSEKDFECLPFKLNLRDVLLSKKHQAKFINLIYSNQEFFSLHNKDLDYYNCLTHTILTSTDKPLHLPCRTILRQLQGEVCKCLNTWLHQEIIHQSNSPYAPKLSL